MKRTLRFAQYKCNTRVLPRFLVATQCAPATVSQPAVPPACPPKTPRLQRRSGPHVFRTSLRLSTRACPLRHWHQLLGSPSVPHRHGRVCPPGLVFRGQAGVALSPARLYCHDPYSIDSALRLKTPGRSRAGTGPVGGIRRPTPTGTSGRVGRPAYPAKYRIQQCRGACAFRRRAGRGACRPAPAGHLRVLAARFYQSGPPLIT